MINADELYAMLDDEVGDELMHEQKQDLADALLKKYVLVERPDVGEVWQKGTKEEYYLGDKGCRADDAGNWRYRLSEVIDNLRNDVRAYEQARVIVAFHAKRDEVAKTERREEIARESGHERFDSAPEAIKILVARLVNEEFKNARK